MVLKPRCMNSPHNAKPIQVERAVTEADLFFCGSRVVVEEVRQEAVVHLFRDCMVGEDEHILEETRLRRRQVGKPPAHGSNTPVYTVASAGLK